jgi:hypothetical protein
VSRIRIVLEAGRKQRSDVYQREKKKDAGDPFTADWLRRERA